MAYNGVVILLLLNIIAHVYSNRLSGHPFFKFRNNATTTTPATTSRVVVGDKIIGPTVVFKSSGNAFLEALMNRRTYFSSDAGAKNNSRDNSDKSAVESSRPPTQVLSNSFNTDQRDTTSTRDQTITQTLSTTITATTPSTTTGNANNQLFNPDGTVNRNRPAMLPFPTRQQTENIDRRFQTYNLYLQSLRRRSFLDTSKSRSRSNDPETNKSSSDQPSNSTSTTPAQTQGSSSRNNGAVEVDSNGGVYIVNNKPTSAPSSGVTDRDKQGPTFVDVQDKPFYGTSQGWYFNDDKTSGQLSSTPDHSNTRLKRQVNSGLAVGNGSSCYDTDQFEPCQFYPRCFPALIDTCKTRDSFLGDVVARLCVKTMTNALPTHLQLLTSYFSQVHQCVRRKLSEVLESPSCDDVNTILTRALLVPSKQSCLYVDGMFCNVTENADARPAMARMLNSPTGDLHFMSRIIVSVGEMASFCRGPGTGIFITDLIMLITSPQSPFKDIFSNTPIPGVAIRV